MTAFRTIGVRWIALALVVLPGTALAKTVDRYVAAQAGVTIEVSAPRADVIRIRAGKGALAEGDAV